MVGSLEHLKNVTNKDGWYIEDLTVNIQAIATNMWSPQSLGLNQTVVYAMATVSIVSVLTVSLVTVAEKRKSRCVLTN